MPTYEFRCPDGHVVELVQPMAKALPVTIRCDHTVLADDDVGVVRDGIEPEQLRIARCAKRAKRVFSPLAAIHFRGRGFYATDVNSAQRRRRRPNPGDDLFKPHDPDAAAIARSL